MVSFKTLSQIHPEYDADLTQRLRLLYKGGYEMKRNAKLFLPPLVNESQVSYNERVEASSYLPYFANFVNYYAALLFSSELCIDDALDSETSEVELPEEYDVFQQNCDKNGTSLHLFIQDVFRRALVTQTEYVGVDFMNDASVQPANRAEEEMLGLAQFYLYNIDKCCVINWKKDELGKFDWLVMQDCKILQPSPLEQPMKVYSFKVWIKKDGVVSWQLFETKPLPLNKEPKQNEDVPLVAEGRTTFDVIPIFELALPKGIAIGDKIGPVVEEFFQRRSLAIAAQNKACIAIPVLKLGPEVPAVGEAISDAQMDPTRGSDPRGRFNDRGWIKLGANDDLQIVEAVGSSHALLDKQLQDLKDYMHELVHQMANAATTNTKALGRSADSKRSDKEMTEIILSSYATVVKECVKKIMTAVSVARGESISWSIEGLHTSMPEDRKDLIAEAMMIPNLAIPSKTFMKNYMSKVAIELADGVSIDDQKAIIDEIEDAIEGADHIGIIDDGEEEKTSGDN